MAKRLVNGDVKMAIKDYIAARVRQVVVMDMLDDLAKRPKAQVYAIQYIKNMIQEDVLLAEESLTLTKAKAMRELLAQIGGTLTEKSPAELESKKRVYEINLE